MINKTLNIIWIWGSISAPNPRLPSYIVDNLKKESHIILTSSKDAAVKNTTSEKWKILTEFNTDQKIKLIQKFTKEFFPERLNKIKIDFSPKTNEINDKQWLEFWKEIENNMTREEKENTEKVLNIFNQTWDIDKWKIYSARHPFWFKDLTLPWENESIKNYENINTYGWKQEWFFNFIRDKSLEIPDNKIRDIFWTEVIKNEIQKIITSDSKSKIVPYWEWTTWKNNSKRSIEYPIYWINKKYEDEYKLWNLKWHYEQKRQIKAWLNYDIEKILSIVDEDKYQDFINNFSKEYKKDLKNI